MSSCRVRGPWEYSLVLLDPEVQETLWAFERARYITSSFCLDPIEELKSSANEGKKYLLFNDKIDLGDCALNLGGRLGG